MQTTKVVSRLAPSHAAAATQRASIHTAKPSLALFKKQITVAPVSAAAGRSRMTVRAMAASAVTKKVFFDITIGGEDAGRIVMGLYGDEVPKVCVF